MSLGRRLKAFVAYLFLAFGALIILLFNRNDRFAAFHARQSLLLTVIAVAAPAVWALLAYPVTFVPFVGPLLAAASFALIIALLVALMISWISGMIFALRAQAKFVPFFGELSKRIQLIPH